MADLHLHPGWSRISPIFTLVIIYFFLAVFNKNRTLKLSSFFRVSDCGFSLIKLIWNRSRHMFGTKKAKWKWKWNHDMSCYNVADKRYVPKTIVQHRLSCWQSTDNPSTGWPVPRAKVLFFSKTAWHVTLIIHDICMAKLICNRLSRRSLQW